MYVTRREWGARAPKAGPGPLDPEAVEGIALHWPAMSRPVRGLEAVASALRSWQGYHMDGQGWSDIGYQEAVDQDGNVYQLRGLSTQSGANGSEDVNERFGALLLIVAPGERPSPAMVAAVRRRIAEHRARFPNSRRIVGHQDVRPEPTACPGPIVQDLLERGVFKPGPRRNRVTDARAALRDAAEHLDKAAGLLQETPKSRTAARGAGRIAAGLSEDVEALLERMPKR